MRVRILRLPAAADGALEGFDLSRYEVAGIYDIEALVAELLVVCGYAAVEMRSGDRRDVREHDV